jgi:leucyl aminopeptidase
MMLFKYTSDKIQNLDADSLVLFVPVFDKIKDRPVKELNEATCGGVETLLDSKEFTGQEGEVASVLQPQGYKAKRVILVGLGEEKKLNPDSFRRAAGTVSRFKGLMRSKTVAFGLVDQDDKRIFQATIEGYLLGSYQLLEFKSKEVEEGRHLLSKINFVVDDPRRLRMVQAAVERGVVIAEGQLLVRRLSFTPGNYLTPTKLAETAQELARTHKFTCRVLDKEAIEKEKMGGLLAVSKGSIEPPCFIVLKYNGGRAGQSPVVLVGKGVTFDAGGISLKDKLDMHEMKGDMAGAATVIAAFVTAARLKLPLNLVGLIPTTENMPSGSATKPGDVVTMRKGLTVEIINTDAEGRLILADALDYANKFNPQAVIDIATLTGGALYVLGYSGAPILGNNHQLLDRIKEASNATAERVWEMPIWDDHRERMKSPIADLVNSGGKPAATITASAFLENFVGDWPWAHIDIAYCDLERNGKPHTPKGATGFGLRLLVELLSNWKKLK